ncbi:hypothetical protein JCGZ_24123 [Jatropha curcas]|uniref:Uncharacterized protein n=1 Tax=Jatropha curcas TaxID=180498 RepID=A0A067LGH6_JATCU|nr:hypothetical protein JCGZ_24123 [Jatropha curcas]
MDYDHSNYISEIDCPDADMEESVVQERPKEYTLNLRSGENEAEEEMAVENPVFQQMFDEVPAETHLHHDHPNFCNTNSIDSTILDGTLEIDIGVDGYFNPFLNEDRKDSDETSLGDHELDNAELVIARENKIKMINTIVDHGSGLGLDVPIANSHSTQHDADQFKEEDDERTAGIGPMIVSEYEATNEEFSSTCSSEEGVLESTKRKIKAKNVL